MSRYENIDINKIENVIQEVGKDLLTLPNNLKDLNNKLYKHTQTLTEIQREIGRAHV